MGQLSRRVWPVLPERVEEVPPSTDRRRVPPNPDGRGVTACVPLVVGGRRIGAIVMFRLLPQKPKFEPFDHELLMLLATHAATALYCSELHEREGMPS